MLGKIFFSLIDLPFSFVRDITIPSVELEKWNRQLFILMPFSILIFVTLLFNLWEDLLYNPFISVGSILFTVTLCVINCKFTYRNRLPRWITLISIISFVMSIIWIWFIAKILIQILDLIGLIFDIPAFFIGMTLLSFGNSLPDLTLNCALAKAGYGEMGLAGSIAGPLFNLLVGLGASLIKKNLKTGTIEFQLFKSSHIVILISILILAINLIRLIIQAAYLKFRLNKYVSIVGYILYTFFFISICLFTFVFPNLI